MIPRVRSTGPTSVGRRPADLFGATSRTRTSTASGPARRRVPHVDSRSGSGTCGSIADDQHRPRVDVARAYAFDRNGAGSTRAARMGGGHARRARPHEAGDKVGHQRDEPDLSDQELGRTCLVAGRQNDEGHERDHRSPEGAEALPSRPHGRKRRRARESGAIRPGPRVRRRLPDGDAP